MRRWLFTRLQWAGKETDLSVAVNRLTAPLLQSFLIFFEKSRENRRSKHQQWLKTLFFLKSSACAEPCPLHVGFTVNVSQRSLKCQRFQAKILTFTQFETWADIFSENSLSEDFFPHINIHLPEIKKDSWPLLQHSSNYYPFINKETII